MSEETKKDAGARWDVPVPKGLEPGWFERSSWAQRDWERALALYWKRRLDAGYPRMPDKDAPWFSASRNQAVIEADLTLARKDYRRRILGWFEKLCMPLANGQVLPNEVELLLKEEAEADEKSL